MTEKRLTTRDKKSIEKKERIIKNAVALFKRYGYDATTVQDICTAADVSVGIFYHHFGSKDAVVKSVANQIIEKSSRYIRVTEQNLADPISSLCKFYIDQAVIAEKLGHDILSLFASLYGQLWINYLNQDDNETTLSGMLIPFIRAAQQKGTFDSAIPAEEVAFSLHIIGYGIIATRSTSKTEYDLEDLAKQVLPRFLDTFRQDEEHQ